MSLEQLLKSAEVLMDNFKDYLPHREPFLFIDTVDEITDDTIKGQYTPKESAEFFKGHFPGAPVMPGVLMCESLFQLGCVFLTYKTYKENPNFKLEDYHTVISRIEQAKFKHIALPGQKLLLQTTLKEKIDHAHFMRGVISNQEGKKILTLDFCVNLAKR